MPSLYDFSYRLQGTKHFVLRAFENDHVKPFKTKTNSHVTRVIY